MLVGAQAASASPAHPKVVVLVAPLVAYVDAVLGTAGPSQGLLQPGQDPHEFALAPSQAQMLEEADILVIPDLGMSPLMAETMAKHPKVRVIELSKLEGAAPLPYAGDNPWLTAVKKEGHDVDDEAPAVMGPPQAAQTNYKKLPGFNAPEPAPEKKVLIDPHFWLDPERMAAMALPLADAIADFSPAHRRMLEINARVEAQHLRADVLPAMQALLTPSATGASMNRSKTELPFVTYHAAYQYFLARFGLAHTGEITARPEEYMGAKSLDRLLESAKKVHVRCIIGEVNSTLVGRIAELSGAKVVVLSPEQNVGRGEVPSAPWIADDYDRLLAKTAKGFGGCL